MSLDSPRQSFNEYMKYFIERKASPFLVYNMDETKFSQKSKQTKVIVVKGSRNVWSKSAQCNFHITIVVCASAAGFVCPPLYILPGERVTRDVLDECNVPGAVISTAPREFMDSAGFMLWLRHFLDAVSIAVLRPLILCTKDEAAYLTARLCARRCGSKSSLCSSERMKLTSCSH